MKKIALLCCILGLIFCVACEKEDDVSGYVINSFEDIPGIDQPELRRQKGVSEAVPKFVFAQSDEVIIKEIERLAEKHSTDDIKIVEVKCVPDHLLVVEGKRVTNYFTVEYTVEITPETPGAGIFDEAEEWRMGCGGMRNEWQYNLKVGDEKFTFINAENGRSISMGGVSYGNRLIAHQFAPELPKPEQKTFDAVNRFIDKTEKDRGDTYINFILRKLGIKNDELYIEIKTTSTGVENDEFAEIFAEMADELKSNKNVREYMGSASGIRIAIETQSEDLEYIFEV